MPEVRHRLSRMGQFGRLPEYNAWRKMKRRCYTKTDPKYPRYGGRGISVCAEWRLDFLAFLWDMGFRPSDAHSLGRIDNDGDYCPENCRWETIAQQNANRDLSGTVRALA